jgi:hypothetical protein
LVLECIFDELVASLVEPTRNLQIQQSIVAFAVNLIERARTLKVLTIHLGLCQCTTQAIHNLECDLLTRQNSSEQGDVNNGLGHRGRKLQICAHWSGVIHPERKVPFPVCLHVPVNIRVIRHELEIALATSSNAARNRQRIGVAHCGERRRQASNRSRKKAWMATSVQPIKSEKREA